MDDMYWFDDDEATVLADFVAIQRMLGEKGLSVNAEKTEIGAVTVANVPQVIDEIKASLLQIRRRIVGIYEIEEEIEEVALAPEQIQYLLGLLRDPEITEQDAELVLALLREQADDVLQQMGVFLNRFPSLGRNLFSFCRFVENKPQIAEVIYDYLRRSPHVTEDQLFWITKIVETFLMSVPRVRDILRLLYEHPNATALTHAKLLEIPESRYGLSELRHERLRTGASEWQTWAAAVGCSSESQAARNHSLGYFANGGPLNRLIADCVRGLSGE
jgi:hypothetical protein